MRKKSIHKDKKNRKKTYRKKTYRKKTNRKEKYRKSNLKKTKHKKTNLKNINKQRGGGDDEGQEVTTPGDQEAVISPELDELLREAGLDINDPEFIPELLKWASPILVEFSNSEVAAEAGIEGLKSKWESDVTDVNISELMRDPKFRDCEKKESYKKENTRLKRLLDDQNKKISELEAATPEEHVSTIDLYSGISGELVELKEENGKLQETNEELQVELDRVTGESAERWELLKQFNEDLVNTSTLLEECNGRESGLKDALNAIETEKGELESDNTGLLKNNDKLVKAVEEAQHDIKNLREQLDTQRSEEEARETELREKEEELNQRESDIEEELKEMRARIYGFDQEKEELTGKLRAECEEEKLGLKGKNTALEKEKSELKESLENASSFQEQYEGSQVELKKKKDKLQAVMQKLENASIQNKTLTDENTGLKTDSKKLSECLEDIKSKLVEFNVSIARTDRSVYL